MTYSSHLVMYHYKYDDMILEFDNIDTNLIIC